MPTPAEEGLPHKPQPEAQKEEQPLILVYDTIISDGGITSKALSPVTKDSPSTVQDSSAELVGLVRKHIQETCTGYGLRTSQIDLKIMMPHHATLGVDSSDENENIDTVEMFTAYVEVTDRSGRSYLLTDGGIQTFEHAVAHVAYGIAPAWGSIGMTSNQTGIDLTPILSDSAFREAKGKFEGLDGEKPNVLKATIKTELAELLGKVEEIDQVLRQKLSLGELGANDVFSFSWEGLGGFSAHLMLHARTRNPRAYFCREFVLRFT